jgi:lipopolysaccharide transport system permease protein
VPDGALAGVIAGKRLTAPQQGELPVVVIDASTNWRRWLADLYAYRGALRSLVWRNVRSRYKQAALGASWAVLQPLIQVGVFTVVLGVLARVPSGGVPYPVLVLAGLIPWNLFQKVVTEGSASLVHNQHIITKLFFPRIYLVVASGASALVDAVVAIGVLVALMLVYGVAPGPLVWIAVPALAVVVLVSYGLAALLAAVNARWRDVQHAIPFLLQIGLFVTPVLYPGRSVPQRWRWLVDVNPLAGLVEAFRASVLGTAFPDGRRLAISGLASAVLLVAGVAYFTRSERTLVDVV